MLVSSINIKDNGNYKNLLDLFFPIGSIYFTITNQNPASYLGGSWVQVNNGSFGSLLAIAGTVSNNSWTTQIAVPGKYNGQMGLTTNNLPAHTHGVGTYTISSNTHHHSMPRATLHNASTQSYEFYPFQPYNNTTHWLWETTQDTSHSHTLSGASASTGGGNQLCPITTVSMLEGELHKAGDALCLD